MSPAPPRLIDLHIHWQLQYAPESDPLDEPAAAEIAARIDQLEGYLSTTWAAILSCRGNQRGSSGPCEPWAELADCLARHEAEFPGRLLIGPDDFARWQADPNGLMWGLLGVKGFDALIRGQEDLDRLGSLFQRGVRLFQPVCSQSGVLGGAWEPDDDRSLTALGTSFLEVLDAIARESHGPRPLLDLAGMNRPTTSAVLDWFDASPDRASRVIPVRSRGPFVQAGSCGLQALSTEQLARLRNLGGVVGCGIGSGDYPTAQALKSAIDHIAERPFLGRTGYEGIALATYFLEAGSPPFELGNAGEVVAWTRSEFGSDTGRTLIQANAAALLASATGSDRARQLPEATQGPRPPDATRNEG
jgi:membrane dipeptidase